MNGLHDLGGIDWQGPVEPEENEPIFHADWEKRVFGLFATTVALRAWNLDEMRHAIERMPGASYFNTSYYEHWLHAFETLLVEKGVLTEEELASGRPAAGSEKAEPALPPAAAKGLAVAGASTRIDADVAPRFRVGDAVRARNEHPLGHTRLPRYARGARGEILSDHGVFIFADSHARGEGACPQHLYGVRFEARELFGDAARPSDRVVLDLWDDHLEKL
ncbi:MAG: nitrile hydratase subunit beta [Myxococcales bacterium]|nr:nitrile hydratase subunit beta [Myxococcales bacterium]